MATLRSRIIAVLGAEPESRFTNAQIASRLEAPLASVRRMTLDLISRGDIMTDGATKQPYVYFAVPSPAPSRPSVD